MPTRFSIVFDLVPFLEIIVYHLLFLCPSLQLPHSSSAFTRLSSITATIILSARYGALSPSYYALQRYSQHFVLRRLITLPLAAAASPRSMVGSQLLAPGHILPRYQTLNVNPMPPKASHINLPLQLHPLPSTAAIQFRLPPPSLQSL
jgi:hypothetical protein